MLGGIIVSIAMWLSNTMLTSKTNGFNEMAIYNAASQWQNIVLFIPLAISQISLPLFSNSKHDIKKFVKLIKYNVLINLVVCSLLAIIFSVFSKFIMQSYGNSFKEGSVILIVLSVTAILISINSVIGQVIAGMGRMWIGLVVNIIWAITFLLIAREFIDRGYGAMGLAKAMFIAYLLHTIIVTSLSFFFLKRNSAHPMTSLPVAND
jgi:O-antigen/teichoic acid export membrane protein